MTADLNACVVLRAAGVCLVLDLTRGRLPAVVHWGADLGELSDADCAVLIDGSERQVPENAVDVPLRLSLLPEHWTGWTGRPGLRGSRAGRDWSPRFSTTGLTVAGEVVAAAEELTVRSGGAAEVVVEAEDRAAALGLTLRVELLPSGLVRTRAALTNRAAEAYQLDELVLALPVPTSADELLDFAGRWGKERVPQRRALTVGTHLREGRRGRTGADAATVLHAGAHGFDFAHGEVWGVHAAWSGNHLHYAERLAGGQQVLGGGELLLPGEVRLAEGESYESPWLYGSHGHGLDEVASRFHRYLRARPGHPGPDRPVTLNVWEAVYFDHDVDRLLDLADRAADLGVERYVLDDGWFGARRDDRAGLGDWTVSPDVWPEGLHPLVDRVRERGMQFGLWFEPEMVNLDSDVARAHPEWVMATGDRLPVPSRHQQVVNLGIPECYAYIRDAIFAILAEYDVGYIKWDHNRDLVDAGTQPTGVPGVHEQTLALYRLLAEIRAAHPGLEIESCSSGGARVDLGILEHTQRVWVSDCIDPVERQQMVPWTAQLIPLELMGTHIASGRNHTTGRRHDLNFRAATAVFGHLGIEWDLARADEDELAELKAWIEFYKAQRGLLLTGDFVRVDVADDSWNVHGVVAADRSGALYSVALMARPEVASPGRLTFPGLDPARRYRVEPVLVRTPHGLRPPRWWGVHQVGGHGYGGGAVQYAADGAHAGAVTTGAVLAGAGLMAAVTDPEQAVLYQLTALD